jgi:hypothetical protein
LGGGVCFDNRTEEKWGAVERRPPLATKLSPGQPCAIGVGQSEGRAGRMMGAAREKIREGAQRGEPKTPPDIGALYAEGGLARITLKDRESAVRR